MNGLARFDFWGGVPHVYRAFFGLVFRIYTAPLHLSRS